MSLTPDNRLCAFEYDAEWLSNGFSISPLELPLRLGVFVAKSEPFQGNFGIFEDSLPDGYGRYLLHKSLLREGIDDFKLSALDRLSIVGKSGMGALEYSPVNQITAQEELADLDILQAKALEVLSEIQDADAKLLLYKSNNSGGARPKVVMSDCDGHWLIKFRHTYDPKDMGRQELVYNRLARECGIDVPDFKLINDKYFASRRFDIDPDGQRIHTATAGGLLGLSLDTPLLDYRNLLALTGFLTQSQHEVEQLFRRMIFNYLIGNLDDHCKNFSFYVQPDTNNIWNWHLAPAYDLTFSPEGYNGQHATSVNGTGHPSLQDFTTLGTKFKIPQARCREIIAGMTEICGPYLRYEIR